jgi:putative GTP pyrophosphokinase
MSEPFLEILAEYDRSKDLFEDFSGRCEILVRELLESAAYRVHTVTSRVKERKKLEEKLRREGKEYKSLHDVTDLAGVRIITHFEDEVDRVGRLIEGEFNIDPKHSTDKRKLLDPDRFGYLSLHYVCGLHPDRLRLTENRRYVGLQCEIQIRSILQHAWAEIEHDLGYKPNMTIPAPIRRRFSRLAGLLELGDQEFESIRNELKAYEARVSEEIRSAPAKVEIDDVSLSAFAARELVSEIDSEMAKLANRAFEGEFTQSKAAASMLRSVGVTTVEQLHNHLIENRAVMMCLWKRGLEVSPPASPFKKGISLRLLWNVLLARAGEDKMIEEFQTGSLSFPGLTPDATARKIFGWFKTCTETKQ